MIVCFVIAIIGAAIAIAVDRSAAKRGSKAGVWIAVGTVVLMVGYALISVNN